MRVPFTLSPALWLLVDALAVSRLARLITKDLICHPIRMWFKRHLGDKGYDFIQCPWCTGMWISAGTVALTRFIPTVWVYPAVMLAFSMTAGFLAER